MKSEELSQLARDIVLARANDSYLGSDGIQVLTQDNTMLLRLIPICVKLRGESMNLVYQGLSRTGGDLRSPSSGSPTLGVVAATSSSVSSS